MKNWMVALVSIALCAGITGCHDSEERRSRYAEKKPAPKPLERTFTPPVPAIPVDEKKAVTGPVMSEYKGKDIAQVTGLSGKKVLLVFYAPWCPHCASYRQALVEYAQAQKGNSIVVTINADQYKDLAREYNVEAVPKTVIYVEGMKLRDMVGSVNSKRLTDLIDETFLTK
ncbi:MAG: thioredoxin family protein [Akkermansia sp.]